MLLVESSSGLLIVVMWLSTVNDVHCSEFSHHSQQYHSTSASNGAQGEAGPTVQGYFKEATWSQGYSHHDAHRQNSTSSFTGLPTHTTLQQLPEQPREPVLLSSGLWNCSRVNFTQSQHHVHCNLETECVGGEDEAECPYTGKCLGGQFQMGSSCYVYVRPSQRLSWKEANKDCVLRGGYLASLNTEEEYSGLDDMLTKIGREKAQPLFVGLTTTYSTYPPIYKNAWQWADSTISYYSEVPYWPEGTTACGYFEYSSYDMIHMHTSCAHYGKAYVCEIPQSTSEQTTVGARELLPSLDNQTHTVPVIGCPLGHVTHTFLACDVQSECWTGDVIRTVSVFQPAAEVACDAPMTSLPPMFPCVSDKKETVPYTLVCDHRQDCTDGSDEDFCRFAPCAGDTPIQCGTSQQCIQKELYCNGRRECLDGSDEDLCSSAIYANPVPPPAAVYFRPVTSNRKSFRVVRLSATSPCPGTHFRCPGNGFCLPVFVLCNGVSDCPGREDEAGCSDETYTCPGYYRCRDSTVCVHPGHVCDGLAQCPQHDDELLCDVTCPDNCTCHGLAFACVGKFPASDHPRLRFLDARASGMTSDDVTNNTMLVHLSLADCGLSNLNIRGLPNLLSLDLSDNALTSISISQLSGVPSLRQLSLSRNPVTSLFVDDAVPRLHLLDLDLSRVLIPELDVSFLQQFVSLQNLNLSASQLQRVPENGFRQLKNLRVLDLRGCPTFELSRGAFKSLGKLQTVFGDDYKLCCPATLPEDFNINNCLAPSDVISSCDNLLRSNTHRALLSVYAVLNLLGNVLTLVVRRFVNSNAGPSGNAVSTGNTAQCGIDVLIDHLSVSNIITGLYLSIIVTADRLYQGRYLWVDVEWRESVTCRVAGFMQILASVVCVVMIVLITLERLFFLFCPSRHQLFEVGHAHWAAASAWGVGLVVSMATHASVSFYSDGFRSSTALCTSFPLRGEQASVFVIILAFNTVSSVMVAVGLTAIHFSLPSTLKVILGTTLTSQQIYVTRRVIPICLTFLIQWFMMAFVAPLTLRARVIPDEMAVTMVMTLLPLGPTLTPLLYAYSVVRERRREELTERLLKQIIARSKGKAKDRS